MNVLTVATVVICIASCCCVTLDILKFLQPDDVLDGGYDDLVENLEINENICTRICDGTPKLCYYEFTTEQYTSMGPACRNCSSGNIESCYNEQCVTADGVERGILTINRKMPGPSIQVCLGDTIVVDVINSFRGEGTSIHWHGVKQKGTQYYDGVPKVTQCPIQSGTTFRYQFKAEDPGTYFYHSHSSLQKADGLSGPLVIRQPIENEIYGNLYDYDLPSHVIYIGDWMHIPASEKVPGFSFIGHLPDSYLINGKGQFSDNTTESLTPISEFIVKPGKKYRFRLIGGTCLACSSLIMFEDHIATVINADAAGPVQPVDIDGVVLTPADRFDIILNANQISKAYWIVVQSHKCIEVPPQIAILRYEGYTGLPDTPLHEFLQLKPNRVLNPSNSHCTEDSNGICISQLKSTEFPPNEIVDKIPEIRIGIEFGFYYYTIENLFRKGVFEPFFMPFSTAVARATVNANVTFAFPPSPLLSQYNDIPESSFCDPECYNPQHNKTCICTNVIEIPLGSSVDVIITDQAGYDPNGLTHPFHLHGHNFYVLEMGIFNQSKEDGLKELNRRLDEGELNANDMPAQKDTIGIPSGGYVVIRFIADNPGFWILHCHFAYHLDFGMAAIFQVGNFSDLPPVPKGFPTCGNYQPSVQLL